MFTITLQLGASTKHDLHGLSALDKRRELGLPDATALKASHSGVQISVSEQVARNYPAFQNSAFWTVYVTLSNCVAGDLLPDGPTGVVLNPDISLGAALRLVNMKVA